jgi:D-amino-acid oxidase
VGVRTAAVLTDLAARGLGHRVGLRPARPGDRLELDAIGGTAVVHNYGHGGAGVTLSWGCAEAVRDLVAQL